MCSFTIQLPGYDTYDLGLNRNYKLSTYQLENRCNAILKTGSCKDKLWSTAPNKLASAQGTCIDHHHHHHHHQEAPRHTRCFHHTHYFSQLVPGTSMGRQGTALASSMGRPTTGRADGDGMTMKMMTFGRIVRKDVSLSRRRHRL